MPQSTEITNSTILRWAGSKRQLISELADYWNRSGGQRYVEPFAGSACLFFNLKPKHALLADINSDLISTYQYLKKDHKKILTALRVMPSTKEAYYKIRAMNPKKISNPFNRAARFIYLNRFCFNGLYRTNRSGQFNVPRGEKGAIPPIDVFLESARLLKNASLLNADFEATLCKVRRGDFVYMDPPFSVRNKEVFTEYDSSKFDIIALKRLRKSMIKLDKLKIPFLVSYLESEEANMLARGFDKKIVSVRRSIAGFASNRRLAREVLISNI